METGLTTKNAYPNEIQAALKSTLVRNCAVSTLNNTIVKAIGKAAQYCGQLITKEDATFIANNLCDVVSRHYPNVRVEEIPVAIERGVLGEYGEYFGLNVASFSKFIKGYMVSETRVNAAKQILSAKEEPKEPSQEEIKAMETEMIVNAFQKFKTDGHYVDFGNHVYRKLDERGLIPFTPERKKEFMEQAKKSVEAKNNPATALSHQERAKRLSVMESLANAIKTADSIVVREAKQIALTEYFKQIQEMDMDINDLLED